MPQAIEKFTYPGLPSRLRRNHRHLSKENKQRIRDAIGDLYVPGHLPNATRAEIAAFQKSPAGQEIISEHSAENMFYHRYVAIPWIDSVRSISNARILEIGCGTGNTSAKTPCAFWSGGFPTSAGTGISFVGQVPRFMRDSSSRC